MLSRTSQTTGTTSLEKGWTVVRAALEVQPEKTQHSLKEVTRSLLLVYRHVWATIG